MMHPEQSRRPYSTESPADACIRDMMGLIALPALWAGRDGAGILQIMSEAIGRVVAFDFCFVQVVLQSGDPEYALLRLRPDAAQPASLAPWAAAARQWNTVRIADGRAFEADSPLGPVQVLGLSMGFGTYGGRIWFGAKEPAFPSYYQLALLRAATSLAATGLQGARVHQEREQASRAKDEFLSMLAHELRNPLAPIMAAAELLAQTKPDPERVRNTSAVIRRQARHMTGLVDDLLDVSRVTRGLIVLDRKTVDLARVVDEAVEQARPLFDVRSHCLELDVPSGPVAVDGDHKRLVQVVSNVLNNAAKYTPNGGRISLRLAVQDKSATMTIADNGVGMSADLVKRAFDLFSQAQRSPDRSQGGLGLGLALVKSLVELHRGTVQAHSPGVGLGSSVTIQLPRIADVPVEQANHARSGAPAKLRLRVLIVDDNVDAAQMLAGLLEALGHTVHVENNAPAALAAAGAGYDVFLLDIGLPEIDGYELAQRLRRMPGPRSGILIALTGYGGEEARKRAAAAGFDHHFVKPIDLGSLSGLLGRLAAAPAQ